MDREVHMQLLRDTLAAYSNLVEYWDRQVNAKGPIGDWPSAEIDRFSRDVIEPAKFLKDELARVTDELRRHDLGVSHNDFGDSGRARGLRQAAAERARASG
ncbi:MAG: hypothetical protein ACRDHX_05215 [Chloroflexota bacterium]